MKAAIYCRLSKEDEDKIGESESIQNQKSMLIQYAMEKGGLFRHRPEPSGIQFDAASRKRTSV